MGGARPGQDVMTVSAAQRGEHGVMDDRRKVIIVVDLLVGFCRRGALASPRLDTVTPRVAAYLERARVEVHA